MIIDLQSISRSPRYFDLTFQPCWWRQNENDVQIKALEAPLIAKIHISRKGRRYVVDGRLTGKLTLICDRCLDAYPFSLRHEFRFYLCSSVDSESIQDETELKKEDLAIQFVEDHEIDLDDIIREQVYLSLPMTLLCGSKCAGLCPRCGVNLNREACKCSEGSGHPAFLKLKELNMR